MLETFEAIKTLQTMEIAITVNGQPWRGEVPVEETLLEFVRGRLSLTGTKRSCESEVCGACTVLVDNKPVSSCNYLAIETDGRSVTTVEGLGKVDQLDRLQEAFIGNAAFPCGYCPSGQLMAAKGLLLQNPSPTYEEIAEWLSENLCRCGTYPAIARAIFEASRK